MNKQILFKIFDQQMAEFVNIREKAPDFIRKVAHLYTLQLTQNAIVPLVLLDQVIEELEHEVLELYRIKTYGFLTLEAYRRHRYPEKRSAAKGKK